MAGQLQGKIALVTGGGSGIGRATALRIAREGAKVMIADYIPDSGERTVKMIKEAGGEANCVAADASVAKQVEMMVAKTVETYGRIDCAYKTPASKAAWPIRSNVPRKTSTASSRLT